MVSAKYRIDGLPPTNSDGKGTIGCLFWLLLFFLAGFATYRIGPPYFAYKSFETDVKAEASRAGANFFDDETIKRNVLGLARKNDIPIKKQNIAVDRYAGQVEIAIQYTVWMDFVFYQSDVNFDIKAVSFLGRL